MAALVGPIPSNTDSTMQNRAQKVEMTSTECFYPEIEVISKPDY